jgi:hypothetical protein
MRSPESDTPIRPSQALDALRIVHFTFMAAVVTYIIVGEVMRFAIGDFTPNGFVDPDEIWAIRLAVLAWSAVAFLVGRALFGDERALERQLNRPSEVDDLLIAQVLQASHITRITLVESIATIGLVVYMLAADRLDLYLFCGIALVALLSMIPSREHWEATYRSLAAQYPTVSPTLA